MTVYASYEYYTETYLGTAIESTDFDRVAMRASRYLDYYTMGRVERCADMDAVKMACCALAEQYQTIETAERLANASLTAGASSVTSTDGGELQSQTVGSWSKSFRSGGDSASSALDALQAAKAALATTAQMYLAGTGLMYRGRCWT